MCNPLKHTRKHDRLNSSQKYCKISNIKLAHHGRKALLLITYQRVITCSSLVLAEDVYTDCTTVSSVPMLLHSAASCSRIAVMLFGLWTFQGPIYTGRQFHKTVCNGSETYLRSCVRMLVVPQLGNSADANILSAPMGPAWCRPVVPAWLCIPSPANQTCQVAVVRNGITGLLSFEGAQHKHGRS